MLDLSVIIISYNTKKLLRDCLISVYKEAGSLSMEVFVVDNASKDGSVEMATQEFPQVKIIANKENLGFAKANNQAMRICRGRYALLLNSDTKVLPEAFARMTAFMEANPQAGICGCRLLNADGTFQRSFKDKNPLSLNLKAADETREVGWVIGAALLIRREAWEKSGLLDENFFFYNEDMEWCYRVRKNGFTVWYVHSAEIIHYGGQSSGKFNPALMYEGYRGGYYFCRKHYGLLALFIYKSAVMFYLCLLCLFLLPGIFCCFAKRKDKLLRLQTYGKLMLMTLGFSAKK